MKSAAIVQRFCLFALIGFSAGHIASCSTDSSGVIVDDGTDAAGSVGGAASGSGAGAASNAGSGAGVGTDGDGGVIDPTGDGGTDLTMDAPVNVGGSDGVGGMGAGIPGTGGDGSTATGGASATGGNAAGGGSAGNPGTGGTFVCTPGPSQCTDCVDNDNDGLIDAWDKECTGPLDNDEATFGTGIPGDNQDDLKSCKQDCFFDGNSGSGGGDCQNNLQCDPLRTAGACTYDANANCTTEQDQQGASCVNICKKLTPNGCDCFGCCQVPGAPHGVRLSDTCSAANVNDPTKCQPCTVSTVCNNTCGECELCFGKDKLPASCFPNMSGTGGTSGSGGATGSGGSTGTGGSGSGGDTGTGGTSGTGGGSGTGGSSGTGGTFVPPPSCPASITPCGPGGVSPEQCPANTYCITGCCIGFVD